MRQEVETDPYATPDLKKSKAAGLIRGAIVVALVAVGGAVAYGVSQSAPPQENAALEQQQAGNQQLADGSYSAIPSTAQPAAPEAAPAPTPAPAPRATAARRSARESAPVEDPAPVPEAPSATPLPATPAPAAPLPPPDVAPSATGQ